MIAAVVVTYSAPAEMLDRCLRAVVGAGGIDRLIVVDTGGAATIAADLADQVQMVATENRGYGAAANLGFAVADGASSIVLLNDDVTVRPGWLDPLVAALHSDGVGAVQPALLGPDGNVASLGVEFDRFGAGRDIGDGLPLPVDRGPREIDVFTGGAVLFDAEFLRTTGGFDERFFLYYEDVDLAERGRRLGWRFRVVPSSTVEHRRGSSTGQREQETRYLQERNRLWNAFRFGSAATVVRSTWLSLRRLRHEPKDVHRRALLTGLGGAPRRLIERSGAMIASHGSTVPRTGMEAT